VVLADRNSGCSNCLFDLLLCNCDEIRRNLFYFESILYESTARGT
jgi:hypothetical protein